MHGLLHARTHAHTHKQTGEPSAHARSHPRGSPADSRHKADKTRFEMQRFEERLCAFVAAELERARAAMAAARAARSSSSSRAASRSPKDSAKADKKELERAAAAASEGAGGLIEALSALMRVREERGKMPTGDGELLWGGGGRGHALGWGGGREGYVPMLEVFTSCWQESKSASSCKKAGVLFIQERLQHWWPHTRPPPVREWVAALPKLLWTLQDRDQALSRECLGILADVCRREHPRTHSMPQVR